MSENGKCEACRAKLYTEILNYYLSLDKSLNFNGGVLKNFYSIFIKLLWRDNQPKRVRAEEQHFIATLRTQGFSIGDIADIVGRSKATIHDALEKTAKLAKVTQA